jgi:site-specific recombinase XerD
MNHTSIDELIHTCFHTLKQLDFKESTIKRHRRYLLFLKDYMRSNKRNLYDESVGEMYQFDILTEGNAKDYRLKDIRHSINLLNDILNHIPVRKKRVHLNTFPLPGEFGKHIQAFLEKVKIESRPAGNTIRMYMISLSHFAVRMNQDSIHPDNLDNIAVSRFVSSLQNTQLRVCVPLRRFLHYLFEMHITNSDLSIPLLCIKCYRKEKLPSIYNTEEIRKMDASIEKSSPIGKRNYAIFLLASRLGLRASEIRLLQFQDLDWDQNIINLIQCKTQKKIELPLLSIIGEAIIDYIRNGRPKSDGKTIFLTAQAPYTPLSVPGLSSIVSHIIYKAGIDTKDRHHGSHCLRHSLATRLLEQGTTLPIISDTLGHSDSQTTMSYLGVEIKGLLRCSLEVPPVNDCFYMQKGGWFYE